MLTIYANSKINQGTNHSRRLRKQNQCPAIIYGNNKPSIPIYINQNILLNSEILNKILKQTITIIIDNTKHIVKTHNIQNHPFKKKIIHIDFIYDINIQLNNHIHGNILNRLF